LPLRHAPQVLRGSRLSPKFVHYVRRNSPPHISSITLLRQGEVL
jgi:hypothetical protein